MTLEAFEIHSSEPRGELGVIDQAATQGLDDRGNAGVTTHLVEKSHGPSFCSR